MITTSASPMVNTIPGAMAVALSLLLVLWSHSMHFILDIDVIADVIAHWLNFISIEALVHVRVLITSSCVTTHWIAGERVVWRLLGVSSAAILRREL